MDIIVSDSDTTVIRKGQTFEWLLCHFRAHFTIEITRYSVTLEHTIVSVLKWHYSVCFASEKWQERDTIVSDSDTIVIGKGQTFEWL